MKLTTIKAREFYQKIEDVCSTSESVETKIGGKNGLSFIFMQIVNSLTMNMTDLSNQKEKIQAILQDQDPNPGPELAQNTEKLGKDLYAYFKGYQSPTMSDYKRCLKRLATFLAFYSNTQIPESIKALYDNETKAYAAPSLNLQVDDLIDNPTTRVPVVLCLDTSGSMMGTKIAELNSGVKQFFDSVLDDEIAKYSVELCIVTFSTSATKVLDFSSIERQVDAFSRITLHASGNTAMGQAVNMSLDLLDQRKKEYQDKGVDYWQPWLVLMTDGQPTDDISSAVARVTNLIEDKKLTIFPIGIGDGVNMARLKQFSPKREPLKLKGLMLSEFFNWLGKSVKCTSQSTPGATVKLPPIGWAEL